MGVVEQTVTLNKPQSHSLLWFLHSTMKEAVAGAPQGRPFQT